MRGRNEDQLIPLIEFAAARNLILRFIEMMPVSTTEVLDEEKFHLHPRSETHDRSHYGERDAGTRVSDEWTCELLPNSRPLPTHRFYRRDDKPAFLRELQQTSSHL